MTRVEAEQLHIGDRVIWDGNTDDTGTVIEKNWMAAKIEWDNGQICMIHLEDMRRVSRA